MTLPKLKLISHKLCPYVQRARIVLDEKSIPHEIEFIDLAAKPIWFLELSPLGKVPLLLVDDEPIFESSAITEFLDEITPGSLHPGDPLERAKNRAWIEFASSTLSAIASLYSAQDRQSFDRATLTLRDRFRALDAVTLGRPYFNGQAFSLVDAAFATVFRYFEVIDRYADFDFVQCTRLTTWRNELRRRPSVQRAVVSDYAERLHTFLLTRNSILALLLADQQVA